MSSLGGSNATRAHERATDTGECAQNAIEYTFGKHQLTADVAIVPDDGSYRESLSFVVVSAMLCCSSLLTDAWLVATHTHTGVGGFTLVTEQKGALTLNLTVQSSSAPVSRPWEAPNPTHLLLQDVHAILQLPHKNNTREEAGGLALCENADGSRWHTTCSLSRLSSGMGDGANAAANSLQDHTNHLAHRHPTSATGILEVRFTNEWEPDELLGYIKTAVRHSQVSTLFSCPAVQSTRSAAQGGGTHDYVAEARSVIEAELGHEVPLGRAHSPSDARFPASRGIPTVIFGPKFGHTDNSEWLDVPSLVKYHHVVERLIKKWGSIE